MPRVEIVVIDAQTKRPVFGAGVMLDSRSAVTDIHGRAVFTVPRGTYMLRIRTPIHEPLTERIKVTEDMKIARYLRPLHL